MSLGSLRVDETIMPITSLRLVLGGLEIVADARGPMDAYEGPVRLFTGEGQPVTDGAVGETASVSLPGLEAGNYVRVTYTLRFGEIHA